MQLPYELFAGLRYTRAKRRNHFISFISLVSMLGIAIGVMALIVVLSVMNGFERELRTRILGMASHATISPDRKGCRTGRALSELAKNNTEIEAFAPYIEGEGMMRVGGELFGTMLRGVLPDYETRVSEVAKNIKAGSLDSLQAGAFNIVLGAETARTLGVGVGDKVDLMIPQASVTPAGVLAAPPPLHRRRHLRGRHVRIRPRPGADPPEPMRRRCIGMGGNVTGVRLKLHDLFRAPHRRRANWPTMLAGVYYVSDWTRSHANFFRAVRTEKMVMFIILSLIVGVAAFNIVSTLVMVVQDKQADIAILRTLGATPRSIMQIFMVQGSLIGMVGTLLGVAGGVLLALNVETAGAVDRGNDRPARVLSPDVYYISDLPSDLNGADVFKIAMLSLAMGLFSTLYPALRASQSAAGGGAAV